MHMNGNAKHAMDFHHYQFLRVISKVHRTMFFLCNLYSIKCTCNIYIILHGVYKFQQLACICIHLCAESMEVKEDGFVDIIFLGKKF